MAYRRRGRADLAQELTDDPMGFARAHWLGRHPRLRWLAYSDGDMLGPGRVLRLWVPVLRPVVRLKGGAPAAERLNAEPVGFVRSLRNPVARAVGRLLFPMGERS